MRSKHDWVADAAGGVAAGGSIGLFGTFHFSCDSVGDLTISYFLVNSLPKGAAAAGVVAVGSVVVNALLRAEDRKPALARLNPVKASSQSSH